MIELQNVTKKFGSRLAVDEVSLHVPAGEIYGLLGHNGAGKSTAIGMMLGQVWPTRGQVRVDGFDVATHRQQALRQVGAIFETPAFYDYLSGWRNLEILSAYTGPASRERLREVADWVGLSARVQSKVRTYSHGMRARLAIAQALLPAPKLLILDEPGDGLDPEGIHEMRHTILRLHRELGLTLLLSSHLLGEVEQLCTRIAVLNQGRLVFEGAMAEARSAQHWVRLRTNDFAGAARQLQAARLIEADPDGQRVQLAAGVGVDQLVRQLVQWNYAVFEVAYEKPTLEDFYLDLMKQPGRHSPPRRSSRIEARSNTNQRSNPGTQPMKPEERFEFRESNLVPTLRDAASAQGLKLDKLGAAAPIEKNQWAGRDRRSILVSDSERAVEWRVNSLSELFRGDAQPPPNLDLASYFTRRWKRRHPAASGHAAYIVQSPAPVGRIPSPGAQHVLPSVRVANFGKGFCARWERGQSCPHHLAPRSAQRTRLSALLRLRRCCSGKNPG